MTDFALANHGKPAYSRSDLEQITMLELLDRKKMIDNPIAQKISQELWHAATPGLPADPHIENRQTPAEIIVQGYRPGNGKGDRLRLDALVSADRARFLKLLEGFRLVNLSQFVMEDTQELLLRMRGTSPINRLMYPDSALKSSGDIVPFMLNHHQLLLKPGSANLLASPRSHLLYNLPVICIMIVSVSNLWMSPVMGIGWKIQYTIWMLFVTAILFWAPNMRGIRKDPLLALALYISFTDEFVVHEIDANELDG